MIAGGGGGANVSCAGGTGGSSLTFVSNPAGTGSAFGGGGGGAQGGTSEGGRVRTTIDNPAIDDIAFMSHVTDVYKDYCDYALVGYMKENKTGYPVYRNEPYSDELWSVATLKKIGGLNQTLFITSTDYSSSEYHYNKSMNTTATLEKAPYYDCFQAGGGFARTFIATYPTNGNTNLVLSASQKSPWHAVQGYIEFIVENADTGEVIHSKRIVEGDAERVKTYNDDGELTASGYHLYAGCWTDLTIPEGVENVTVTTKIFILADAAHTNTYLTDTFFYGKEIVTTGQNSGGTSYINTGYGCKNQFFEAGRSHGDGYGTITGKIEAFVEETYIAAVRARDTAAPDRIVLNDESIKALGKKEIKVTWKEPEDNGTVYYHRCESYCDGEKQLDSNITQNTIISGIKGYYYYVDSSDAGMVTAGDAYVESVEQKGSVYLVLDENVQYLHVAAVDIAGNIGATTDIELWSEDDEGVQYPADDSYPEQVGLFTKQLEIEDTEFVHRADEKSWFVKADGVTEHTVHISAGMDKAATTDFQINCLLLNVDNNIEKEWIQTQIPLGDIARNTESFSNSELNMSMSEHMEKFLYPGIAAAERINHGMQVEFSQCFTVKPDISEFYIYPQAIAEFKDKQYFSAENQDIYHGLTMIPDRNAPEIFGLEELQELKVLDMTEESKQIVLWAKDDLSGLGEFTLVIRNIDNYMKKEFSANGEGKIIVDINKDNPLFAGEIEISVLAADRVGNAAVIGKDGITFTLETNLYKSRAPEENILKAGDGAILDIFTCGYVERIEVNFPKKFLELNPDMNRIYEYEQPALRHKESLTFNIPLGTAAQEYEVVVKAYKNGQVLVSKPVFCCGRGKYIG